VLHENAVVMTAQVVAVNADDDPALAGHATNQNSLISVHCPFSPGIRKEPKKEKPPRIRRRSWLAGALFSPPHRARRFRAQGTLKVGFSLTSRLPDGSLGTIAPDVYIQYTPY